jgi:endoribonuclease Dicer
MLFKSAFLFQRLEFLGDSVLDLLITRYLYVTHTDVDPGELTDLRSALVSNENFAQVVVRNNVHSHLKHGSGILLEQVTEYVRSNSECQGKDNEFLQHATSKVPKVRNTVSYLSIRRFNFVLLFFLRLVFLCGAFHSQHYTWKLSCYLFFFVLQVLGDIMESIAGAIFVDSDFNVDLVWKIVEPLLSPMITPDNLALPPYRELLELCSHLGYFINSKCSSKGEEVIIDMSVQLRDELLIAQGHDRNKKSAKAKAAARILADLKVGSLIINNNIVLVCSSWQLPHGFGGCLVDWVAELYPECTFSALLQ